MRRSAAFLLFFLVLVAVRADDGATSPTLVRLADDGATSPTLVRLDEEAQRRFIERGMEETKDIRRVWSRFLQRRHLAVFDEVLEARGEMAFARDGFLRWELKEPFRSVLVRNDSGIGKWEWKDEQWRKMRLGGEGALSQMLERIGGWMQGDLEQVEKEGFAIAISREEGKDVWQVVMTPKSEEQRKYIEKIVMRLEGERPEIRRVELFESGDNRTEILFSDRALNPVLPERYFDPSLPPESLESTPRAESAD